MKSRGKKRDRARRQHAAKVDRRQGRARRRQSIAKLIQILTRGEAEPDNALVDAILTFRGPDLRVLPDPSLLSIAGHEVVLADVRRALDACELRLQPHGVSIALRRYFSYYFPLAMVAHGEIADNRRARRAQSILAKHVVPDVSENMDRAMQALGRALADTIVPRNSMDRVFFIPKLAPPDRLALTITVAAHRATPAYFAREGKERPAWRCGGPAYVDTEIEWVTWTAEVRGAPPGSPPADVFLQSHALRNLRDRIPAPNFVSGLLHFWAYQSFKDPKLIPMGREEWLVEFQVAGIRLGYFTAVKIDGRILATTFLFLTMRGTPEGKRIREILGLRAEQIEWLKMDKLPYFTQSDAAQDAELRAALTACGCGHLFDLIEPGSRVIALPGKAQETRRHMSRRALRSLPAFCYTNSPSYEAPDIGRESKSEHHQEARDNGTDTQVPADGLRPRKVAP